MRARTYLLMTVVALLSALAVAEPPEGEGWESLFNGQNLDGWEIRSGNEGIWSVVDGVVDCNPRADMPGDNSLWSTESFGDFVLHVEWRIKETKGVYPMPTVLADGSEAKDDDGDTIVDMRPNADSGIYLRGSSKAQVNIWCWPVGSGEVYGYRTDATMPSNVRAGVTPEMNADHPVGEWNTFVITMRGNLLTVELNGHIVIENAPLPGVPDEGPIALQHHGGYDAKSDKWNAASSLVQFRNLYIKSL